MRARFLTPDAALVEYLVKHGMKRISKRLATSGALDVVATAVPGMKDILVLGKVKSIEESRAADLVIVDAPAAGHAVTFLLSARGLLDAVRVGPIRKQAQDVVSLISDPKRCQVMLVTLAEETPVSEVVDTAFAIEDRAGVALGPVVVNGCFAPLPVAMSANASTILDDARAADRFVSQREGDDLAARGRVPRRAARPPRRTDPAAPRAPAVAADRAAVRLQPRHHARAARHARRRVRGAESSGCDDPDRRARRRPPHRHLLWHRRRRQDDDRRRARARERTSGAKCVRRDHRPRRAASPTPSASNTSPTTRPRSTARSGPARRERRRCRRTPVGAHARHQVDVRSCSSRATPRHPSRRSGSSTTASIATSPVRSVAPRSTWRWRSCTNCTTRATSI